MVDAIHHNQRSSAALPQADADPFLRKNQIWFQKILPPSIAPIKVKKNNERHLDQIATLALNPSKIERARLAPSKYNQQLRKLQKQLHTLGNQIPQSRQISFLLQNEISLMDHFYDQKLIAQPC